ncbi:hypothetical protein FDZ71_17625, partial [bacterium]
MSSARWADALDEITRECRPMRAAALLPSGSVNRIARQHALVDRSYGYGAFLLSYLLGIDLGTTSVKCVLFDREGGIVASGRCEYELSMPKPEFVEVDAETYWNALRKSLEVTLNLSKADARDILGIGVSSQGETFMALDNDCRPLGRAI